MGKIALIHSCYGCGGFHRIKRAKFASYVRIAPPILNIWPYTSFHLGLLIYCPTSEHELGTLTY